MNHASFENTCGMSWLANTDSVARRRRRGRRRRRCGRRRRFDRRPWCCCRGLLRGRLGVVRRLGLRRRRGRIHRGRCGRRRGRRCVGHGRIGGRGARGRLIVARHIVAAHDQDRQPRQHKQALNPHNTLHHPFRCSFHRRPHHAPGRTPRGPFGGHRRLRHHPLRHDRTRQQRPEGMSESTIRAECPVTRPGSFWMEVPTKQSRIVPCSRGPSLARTQQGDLGCLPGVVTWPNPP